MSKKTEFMEACARALDKGNADSILLGIHMPDGGTEYIQNTNVEAKAAYIDRAYDDELRLRTNPEIYIETYNIFQAMADDSTYGLGIALNMMKSGYCVRRAAWEPEKYIFILPEQSCYGNVTNAQKDSARHPLVQIAPYIGVHIGEGVVVPWFPTQGDMLAEDYSVDKE